MDELIKTALAQSPGLVVLFLLVQMFLRRDRERDTFIAALHSEHMAARGESRQAIKENTESNLAVAKSMINLSDAVRSQFNH